ncbi:transporter [uncultured Methylobacterium sp.]|uniref:transporter n=1 Tax=uncultured Methylobacterium sp. TaxID=157278 RepID=UPI0035CAA4DC
MIKNWLAAGALALTAGMTASTAAHAQATTIPGEQVGLAAGAPLPEGVYAVDTFIYRRPDAPFGADTAINVPFVIWASPYKILGARIEPLIAAPTVFAFTRNPAGTANRDISINVGPLLASVFAWDLGNGFGVSYLAGAHLNDALADRGSLVGAGGGTPVLPQLSSNTYRQGFAASYTGDGYNLTANLTHNFYDSPGRFSGPVGRAIGPLVIADALLLDLTATKKFGKFEIGAVGYGVTDLSLSGRDALRAASQGYTKTGRFALGGLIGYDFGPFTAQLVVARDVASRATYVTAGGRVRENDSTDGFFRIVAPLYAAAAAAPPPAPLVRKY